MYRSLILRVSLAAIALFAGGALYAGDFDDPPVGSYKYHPEAMFGSSGTVIGYYCNGPCLPEDERCCTIVAT